MSIVGVGLFSKPLKTHSYQPICYKRIDFQLHYREIFINSDIRRTVEQLSLDEAYLIRLYFRRESPKSNRQDIGISSTLSTLFFVKRKIQ